jgi:hypothetical protein
MMCSVEAAHKVEWSFILAACSAIPLSQKVERIHPLRQQTVGWQKVLDLAEHHGVLPQVCQLVGGAEGLIPAPVMALFRQADQNNLHKTLLLSRELIRVLDHLASVGIETMPYKGVALSQMLYGDIARRQAGDIDLLIRVHELSRIRVALGQLGYTPHSSFRDPEERAYVISGYEQSFDGLAGPNMLEVQWAIQPRFYAIDFDMESLFRRAVSIEVAGRPVKTLNCSDLLLVLCAHAAKHSWGRLVWLCDIAWLVQSPSLDWDWIAAEANRLGIARIVQTTLLLASKLLEVSIPALAMTQFTAPESYRLVEKIHPTIADPRTADVESLSYFRLMLHLRERRADQLKFLSRLIFTSGPGEWNAVHLPGALFPLYRVVRLFRLTARFARS